METKAENLSPDVQAPLKQPPKMKGGSPFLGHAFQFRKDPAAFVNQGRKELGDVWSFTLFGKKLYVLTGPEATENFFNAPDDQLNPKKIYKLMTPIFGKGIAYDAEPEIMREQLQFLMPALTPVRLRTYAQKIAQETKQFCEKWGEEGEFDIFSMTHELTTYTSTLTLLGKEFRMSMTEEFSHLYRDLENALTPLAYFFPNVPIPRHLRRNRARLRMVKLITDITGERRKRGVKGEDFLQSLMDAHYSDGRTLTEDEITGILLTIIFAGHHTSATLSAWVGIELALHPQFISPILEEMKKIYGDGQEISMETLKEARRMHYAIQEGERLHPPVILLLRNILRDLTCQGYNLPKGQLAVVSPYASHRMERVFSNPERYDPERFMPGRDEGREFRYALLGFGGGKHRCLGFHFAYMQIKTIWTVLLSRYEFESVNPPYRYNPQAMVARPIQPAFIRYRRRKKPVTEIKF